MARWRSSTRSCSNRAAEPSRGGRGVVSSAAMTDRSRRPRARRRRRLARAGRRRDPPCGARRAGPAREPPVPRGGRAGAHRCRVRPAVPRAGRAGGGVPGPDHARLADPEGGRDAGRRPVSGGASPAPDAQPVERLQPRRAARLRRPGPARPGPGGRPRAGGRPDLRRGAQDRRPRGLAALREGPVHAGRHARRRDDRRGRHAPTCARSRRSRGGSGGRDDRGAGRGVHAQGRVRADQRRARGGWAWRCTRTREQRRRDPCARRTRRSPPAGSSPPGCTS